LVLVGTGVQRQAPTALLQETQPIPETAGWTSGAVWTGRKDYAPPGLEPRTVQCVGKYALLIERTFSMLSETGKGRLFRTEFSTLDFPHFRNQRFTISGNHDAVNVVI